MVETEVLVVQLDGRRAVLLSGLSDELTVEWRGTADLLGAVGQLGAPIVPPAPGQDLGVSDASEVLAPVEGRAIRCESRPVVGSGRVRREGGWGEQR